MAAGPVADGSWVRLDVGGPLSPATARRLLGGLRAAEADPACRVAVLAADGPVFCTGMDLAGGLDEPGEVVWELLSALGGSRLVTVAVVEGRAVGGGVGLAAACDFVFAGPEAGFRLTELLFGLVPALVMPFVAARTGEHRMLRMAVLAEPYDASAARGIGLADDCERPWEAVRRLLVALRRLPRAEAVGELKDCRRRLNPPPADYADHARRLLRQAVADPAVRARIARLREEGVLA